MSITVLKYIVNGFQLSPYIGTVDSVTYYGYNTTYSSSAAFEKQETLASTIHLYEDISTNKLSIHIILDAFQNDNTGNNVNVVVSGLPSGANITVQDDPSDTYTWVDSNTISATFNWSTCCTDGFVIDDIQGFNNISITFNTTNGVDKFKFASSNGEVYYQPFSESPSVTINRIVDEIDSYLYLQPSPSVYDTPITISTIASSDVQEVVYTTDGTAPILAKYLAFDDLDPPNPFIAVVEDGRGNVLFDGGFPKWYNIAWNFSWSVFSDLNARFKYLANSLDYIANPNKIAQGNKNILIVGDADEGQNYSVKGAGTNGFNVTFSEVCSIMGYTPTFKTKSDYSGVLDMDYAELDQYCALILMSSVNTSSRFISESAVTDILTFRDQGNGILLVTDHGDDLNTLDDAINSTYSGFFRTANYIATNFNAYFTGNVDRSPVNVGFLRSEYGDHPLWNNIPNTDDIFAGASESSVIVPETQSYPPVGIPLIELDTVGYHTYSYLMRLVNGDIITESYTYGLGVPELLNILDKNNNVINSIGPTNFRQVEYNFEAIPGDLNEVSGLIKKNNIVIGEFIHDGELRKTFYTYDANTPYTKSGDSIAIQITNPLEYVKTVQVQRNQRNLDDTISYGKKISYINRNEWASGVNDVPVIEGALSSISRSFSFNKHRNLDNINSYMNDGERIPEASALIFDTQAQASDSLAIVVPPSPQQVFNEWGVFSVSSTTNEFYNTILEAPDVSPFTTWTYNSIEDRVVQTANVSTYTGFVSKYPIEKYTHEVTLTSPGSDDDLVGVLIAHRWDGNSNRTLSAVISMGGVIGQDFLYILVNYLDGRPNSESIITSRPYQVPPRNSTGGNGWSGKQVRLMVERDGDFIKVLGTNIDNVNEYEPSSEIILDLNSDPRLEEFKGPMSYGYSTQSQANSTYLDIDFVGGLNYSLITSADNTVTNVYQEGTWKQISTPIHVVYDYPRVVRNPDTNRAFYITENNADPYWGNIDSIEVVGTRIINDTDDKLFEILNYNPNTVYDITTNNGSVSVNLPEFTLSGFDLESGNIILSIVTTEHSLNISLQVESISGPTPVDDAGVYFPEYGGYYAGGNILVDGDEYAVIISPKEFGETLTQWSTSNIDSAASSVNDGKLNQSIMVTEGIENFPAAEFCLNLDINGFDDWHLPSPDELEICYRYLKPTMDDNVTVSTPLRGGSEDSGTNPNSNPIGVAYTTSNPSQTTVSEFQDGGSQAFSPNHYWTSKPYYDGEDFTQAWFQSFEAGPIFIWSKTDQQRVRAVRWVRIG